MKLFQTIGEFLRTLFVPAEAPKKPLKPGAQTHGGFRDGFEKAAGKPVNLTGVTPALIVVPEEVAEPAPQPDNDFVASLDDLALDALPVEPAPVSSAPVESAPVESAPVESAPMESAPMESAPVERAPVESALVESAPVQSAPVESAPVESAPMESAAMESEISAHSTRPPDAQGEVAPAPVEAALAVPGAMSLESAPAVVSAPLNETNATVEVRNEVENPSPEPVADGPAQTEKTSDHP